MAPHRNSRPAVAGSWPAALSADLAAVVAFAAMGRRSHAEGLTVAGVAQTAWPFLAGTLVGWLLVRGWRRPTALTPTGVVVWLCTVVIGMALRKATSAGIAASFIAVAALVTGAMLLGWRGVARRVRRPRHRRAGLRRNGS